ncbi:coiled-coil domain-containing protein 181 isoform X1 [Phascolarctos cinereus]|nr:coiled-coil domain-containing protein 181 isoform X2 [Phascolarctos cinereus]XP_020830364.1 coiled-coil domain-containing protein 181 isoform X2 [Phascolarctos cinereus]XP_020830365.1 coiled-coil domain-containing protein 181 isoform X2 [Phascolarctos cinereus]
MNEKTDADLMESGEYEDDFEKDLEWLINEEEKNHIGMLEMSSEKEEVTNQELKEDDKGGEDTKQLPDHDKVSKDEMSPRRNNFISVPSIQPLDPASDSDSENSFQESKMESQKDLDDDEEEEEEEVKRYIMEKIVTANKILETQEPVNEKRERKLKFKDKLVDLEVPPLEDRESYRNDYENERDVSGKLSQLHISGELRPESVLLSLTNGSSEEYKDGKILVERDGKFELLSLQDIESQGFLPPINVNITEIESQQLSPRSSNSATNGIIGIKKEDLLGKPHVITHTSTGEPLVYFPQPPPNPKYRPSSAVNTRRSKASGKSSRRVQSANISPINSTYCLSPRQKERQKQIELRKEKLKREEEQRKREEEKEKKRENEMVFRAWLQKKKEHFMEMRRIQRAKEMEGMNSRQENRDPQQAFRLWLKKKHEEQIKERQIEELRRQEECLFFLRGAEGRDRAFKQWLKRKRIEKLAEQQAAKERARQLRIEARRSKQLQNLLYNISETKPFRFTNHYS